MLRQRINWYDPEAELVDGFTVGEIIEMVAGIIVTARCTACRTEHQVAPNAWGYGCRSCGAEGAVTSPLVKLGFFDEKERVR